jgi:hypothetical protein
MNQLLPIIFILLSGNAYSWTYAEAEAASNAMSEMKHEKPDEHVSKEGEAVNTFFQAVKPCINLGQKEFIIISIDSEGMVLDAAAESSNAKSACLLELAKTFTFAKPPWQPYYIKVKM